MSELYDDREFRYYVRSFWLEKGDPSCFNGWSAERCQRLMPAFYEAWTKVGIYTELANLAAKSTEVADDGF